MTAIYKKYITIASYLLAISLVLTSCEKEIDVDLKSVDPKIVIEALMAKESLATVSITTTKDFNSNNDFLPVSGAIVTISDNAGNTETLLQNEKGLYVSRYLRGVENRIYNLHVIVEDEEFTSTSTMPNLVKIDSIKMYYIPTFGYAVPMVIFQDPAGIENYYRNILYLNGTRMDIGNETTDSKQRDGVMMERILPVFDDDKEDSRKVAKGDTVLVELQCVDKGAYTFFDTLGMMQAGQTNPTNNIKGGALGYFSAYTIHRKWVIAEW